MPEYMDRVFEEICKQYLCKLRLGGKCPVAFSALGRWWGHDPVHKCRAEIDIMGGQDEDTALFGACKWANAKVDLSVLEALVKRGKLFPYSKVHYYLFPKSGSTRGCTDQANKMGNVTLVSYQDMANG